MNEMTNDEAQEWLLALLNATPAPRDAARFGAAIRAIRAKAIADCKEWGLTGEAVASAIRGTEASPLDAAWREAEAALSEAWRLLWFRTWSGDVIGYGIEATEPIREEWGDGALPRVTFVHGPTPADALLALAAALRGQPSETPAAGDGEAGA